MLITDVLVFQLRHHPYPSPLNLLQKIGALALGLIGASTEQSATERQVSEGPLRRRLTNSYVDN